MVPPNNRFWFSVQYNNGSDIPESERGVFDKTTLRMSYKGMSFPKGIIASIKNKESRNVISENCRYTGYWCSNRTADKKKSAFSLTFNSLSYPVESDQILNAFSGPYKHNPLGANFLAAIRPVIEKELPAEAAPTP